ncbi:MAG: thermonuclease family protein [candidate division NC10 bacterium]|jgi:micrococcal nuclease
MIPRWWWLALLLILLPAPVTSQGDSTTLQVVRVIDGDTIQVCCVFGDNVKVRYIGMEAAEANRKLVDGKTVRLKFDVQEQDRYGRLLAYVYLEEGTFVNAWLVQHGYAAVMTITPNVKHQELFLRLQREAREEKRGLWR